MYQKFSITENTNAFIIRYPKYGMQGQSIAYNTIPVGIYTFKDLLYTLLYAMNTAKTYSEDLTKVNSENPLVPEKFTGSIESTYKFNTIDIPQRFYMINNMKNIQWYFQNCKNSIFNSVAFSSLLWIPYSSKNHVITLEHPKTMFGATQGDSTLRCAFPNTPWLGSWLSRNYNNTSFIEVKRNVQSSFIPIQDFYPGAIPINYIIEKFNYAWTLSLVPIYTNKKLLVRFKNVNTAWISEDIKQIYNLNATEDKVANIPTPTVGGNVMKTYKQKVYKITGDFDLCVPELFNTDSPTIEYLGKTYKLFKENAPTIFVRPTTAAYLLPTYINLAITDKPLIPDHEYVWQINNNVLQSGIESIKSFVVNGLNLTVTKVSASKYTFSTNCSVSGKFEYPHYIFNWDQDIMPAVITTNTKNNCAAWNMGNYVNNFDGDKCIWNKVHDLNSKDLYMSNSELGNASSVTIKTPDKNKKYHEFCTTHNECPTNSKCVDYRCRKLVNRDVCSKNSDCAVGACRQGTCVNRSSMAFCETNDDCTYGICRYSHCNTDPNLTGAPGMPKLIDFNTDPYNYPRTIEKVSYVYINQHRIVFEPGLYTFRQLFDKMSVDKVTWNLVNNKDTIYVMLGNCGKIDLTKAEWVAKAIGMDPVLLTGPEHFKVGILYKLEDKYITWIYIGANREQHGFIPGGIFSLQEIPEILEYALAEWWNNGAGYQKQHAEKWYKAEQYKVEIKNKQMTIYRNLKAYTNSAHTFVLVKGEWKDKISFVDYFLFKNAPSYSYNDAKSATKVDSITFDLDIPSDSINTKYCLSTDQTCYCTGDCICASDSCANKVEGFSVNRAYSSFESENKIPEFEDESENNIVNDVQYRFSELNDIVQDTDVKSRSMKFSNKSSIQVLLCVILIGLLVFMNCNKDPTIHWGIIASIIVASILFVFVTLK